MSWIINHVPTTNIELACDERGKPQQKTSSIAHGPFGNIGFSDAMLMKCVRLILQHVLPKGFRRARNLGLHPNSKRLIALLQAVLKVLPTVQPPTPRPAFVCPCCGAPMKVVKRRLLPIAGLPHSAAGRIRTVEMAEGSAM